MENQRPFKTSDRGLAAYLAYSGMILLGCVESGEIGRLFFVFQDTDQRADLVESWIRGNDFKRYLRAYTGLRKYLEQPVTQ